VPYAARADAPASEAAPVVPSCAGPETDVGVEFDDKENPMLQKSPMYAYLPAKDVGRARRFYEEKLGFRPKLETAGGVVYEFASGTACFLYPTPNAGTSSASQAFWQVADVEHEVAELRAKGVVFEQYDFPGMKDGIATGGGAKSAWFKDTEGNILAIVQSI
jgi:catechol 2,3-dioxygenase-like lactoylglutathione lyase family enzyme